MIRIGVILGSTRPNRSGEQVAKWVYDIASGRDDAEVELVDLLDFPLPPAGGALDADRVRGLPRVPPRDHTVTALNTLLDQVVAWSTALAALRAARVPA